MHSFHHPHPTCATLRTFRRLSEQFAFGAASADAFGALIGAEFHWVVLAGKLAFAAGSAAVLVFHYEEAYARKLLQGAV